MLGVARGRPGLVPISQFTAAPPRYIGCGPLGRLGSGGISSPAESKPIDRQLSSTSLSGPRPKSTLPSPPKLRVNTSSSELRLLSRGKPDPPEASPKSAMISCNRSSNPAGTGKSWVGEIGSVDTKGDVVSGIAAVETGSSVAFFLVAAGFLQRTGFAAFAAGASCSSSGLRGIRSLRLGAAALGSSALLSRTSCAALLKGQKLSHHIQTKDVRNTHFRY
jgi:hypothetical protein